jgi:prepilin-type N-terminal cleavage/methylation domain-containing protein
MLKIETPTDIEMKGAFFRNYMRKKSFTLIELLIVLTIIGILATLAMPKYKTLVLRAQGAEAKRVVHALADSVWRYHLEAGHWPDEGPGSYGTPSIPTDIDVSIVNPSQYFEYFYYYICIGPGNPPLVDDDVCEIRARHIQRDQLMTQGPAGIVLEYDILYQYAPNFPPESLNPIPEPGDCEFMDENWYRVRRQYYLPEVGSPLMLDYGWD